MYFVCVTRRAMDTCAAQQSMWHPDKRDCPLDPPCICTFAMSFTEYIFLEALMSKVKQDYCDPLYSLSFLILAKSLHGKMCSDNIIKNIFVINSIHNCQHTNNGNNWCVTK